MNPETLMYDIERVIEEIDLVSKNINVNDMGVFGKISLRKPKFRPAELGFIKTISWFYVLYVEIAKISIEFLCERLVAYGIDTENKLHSHTRTVEHLRTYLQHHIDSSQRHDRFIQETCESWFRTHSGTSVPEEDNQWKDCLIGFLNGTFIFLKALRECVRCIEGDESREQIIHDWQFRLNRYYSPEQFDELIAIVSADMGREHIDPVKLRKRFYSLWIQELRQQLGKCDFKIEARKLIEHALLFSNTPVLPITGKDIIEYFNIEPGQKVGSILNQARIIYDADPCSKDELLRKIINLMIENY